MGEEPVRIHVDARACKATLPRRLSETLRRFPGSAPVLVALETSVGPKELRLGLTVDPDLDGFWDALWDCVHEK